MTTAYILLVVAVAIVGVMALSALIVAGESAADKAALREEVDGYRSEVERLIETVHRLTTPETRPLPIVRGVPTDTRPQEAVVGQVLDAITVEVAHYGRHAHREGVHA